MYQLEKVENAGGLSMALLEQLNSWDSFDGERDLAKGRIKFICDLLRHERFIRCDWAVCRCKEDGKNYRVNGQHTKHVLNEVASSTNPAFEELGFPTGVPVLITSYECDKTEDLADVFDSIDNKHSSRSPDDKLGVFIAQHEDLVGLNKKLINQALCGVDYYRGNCRNVDPRYNEVGAGSAYDRGRLLVIDDVRDFCAALHDYASAPFTNWQQKSGITANLYSEFLRDSDDCGILMEQLFFEVGNDTEKYTKKIRNACSRTGHDQGWYYRATASYISSARRQLDSMGRDEMRKMIRECMEEISEEQAVGV